MGLVWVKMHALTHGSPTSLQSFWMRANQAAEIILRFSLRRKNIVSSAANIFYPEMMKDTEIVQQWLDGVEVLA